MIIASMIVKTRAEEAEEIQLELQKIPHITTHGIYKDCNIIVLIEAETEAKLKEIARYISSEYDGILGTYPTFVSSDDDVEIKNN